MMHNDYEVKTAVIDKYKECFDVARVKGFNLTDIPILFNLNGVAAGQYCYGLKNRNCFRVNLLIAKNNIEKYLKSTVPHKVSHYITHVSYNESGHGRRWKYIMKSIFGIEPSRCHSYDIMNIQELAQKRPNKYICGCLTNNEHYISNLKHKRIVLENTTYICRRCHQKLIYQISEK